MSTIQTDPSHGHHQISHYPTEWIDVWSIGRGEQLTLRPILPQDRTALALMVEGLSPASRSNRFHAGIKGLSPAWLSRLTEIDYEQHMAFVVTHRTGGAEEIVAEARYAVDDGNLDGLPSAEFALTVAEPWQRRGLGRRAISALMVVASEHQLAWLHGDVLADNAAMLALMRRCHFACTPSTDDERMFSVERCLSGQAEHRTHPAHADSWWSRWLPQTRSASWSHS
ncbi:GNAT family protein [Roseateles sp.]|uniref:GNAT family N-acetyltransferase n=1 Tax=Roseateles sp. TaxID=1971397 RepID=UPI00286C8544|nr:GNAT family protein [Roseateles sp.]